MTLTTILNHPTSQHCKGLAECWLKNQREQEYLDILRKQNEDPTLLETVGTAVAYGLGIGLGVVLIALPVVLIIKLVRNRS